MSGALQQRVYDLTAWISGADHQRQGVTVTASSYDEAVDRATAALERRGLHVHMILTPESIFHDAPVSLHPQQPLGQNSRKEITE